MDFTDRGIEAPGGRRGERMTLDWLAAQLRTCGDLHPDACVPVDRLATWLARADEKGDELVKHRASPGSLAGG